MAKPTGKSSSKWPATDWLRRVGIYGMRTIDRCAMCIYSAATSVLVICVCAVLFLPEFLSRNRQASMTQPQPRKLPIPMRSGGEIFAIMPDGERVKIDPLAAKSHAMAWVDVISGLAVFESTRIRD